MPERSEGGLRERLRPWLRGLKAQRSLEDGNARLQRYLRRSEDRLDLLALLTVWLVVLPPSYFGGGENAALAGRLLLSLVYAVDITVRTTLARHHRTYLRTHPVGLLAAIIPPARLVFSARLVGQLFRRGQTARFAVAALILIANGAVIVFLLEREAPGANITSIGDAVWWAAVTVTTVGYGDFYPVTTGGRVVAVCIMAVGVSIIAVTTGTIVSRFSQPGTARTGPQQPREENSAHRLELVRDEVAAARADDGRPADPRLDRIERLLLALVDERIARGGPAHPLPSGTPVPSTPPGR